ncbi:MAG: RHS repeat-associated core domain-containing protein [Xanthomonadales bacterium]|nr:RHS repeat-associated core domain-containing protein [Xanthomonadales bacterium]
MTDAAGNTVTATTFDAWGNPTQQTASGTSTVPWQVPNYNPLTTGQAALLNNDAQTIGFTGYGKDSTTGLYYANARWYDPLVGSFNAMDPAAGIAAKPVTFHRYLYANGNPTYYVDRDGRCGVAAYIGLNYGTCDFADAVLLGVNQNSFEGKIAIERYRQAQAKEILRQGADAVLAGAKLFGDFAVSGRESLTGEDLGAGDEIGAAIQGTLDYFGNLPVNVINGLAELNAEMGAAREQQDPERMGRATAPVVITAVTAAAPAARGLAGAARLGTPNLPDLAPSARSVDIADDHTPNIESKIDVVEESSNGGAPPVASGDIRFKRWSRGDAIDKPLPDGSSPSWDVVRSRYWKNRYEASRGSGEFSAANLEKMRRGGAPADYNPRTGKLEERELHHVVGQQYDGADSPVNLRELTPDWHAEVDPYRIREGVKTTRGIQ